MGRPGRRELGGRALRSAVALCLRIGRVVRSADAAVDDHPVYLTALSVHQNSATVAAGVVDGVTTCVQHWRGLDGVTDAWR